MLFNLKNANTGNIKYVQKVNERDDIWMWHMRRSG